MKKKDEITEKNQRPLVKLSVRHMVEFLLRYGDIDSALPTGHDTDAMLAGGRIHRKVQKSQAPGYTAEVPLQRDFDFPELTLRIEGRADGVISQPATSKGTDMSHPEESDSDTDDRHHIRVTVDEIKGMYLDVLTLEEPFPLHLAQARCYAAIIAHEKNLSEVGVQMTYANLDNDEIKRFHFSYAADELEDWFTNLVQKAYRWARLDVLHQKARNTSMAALSFPFAWRKGQKELSASVYKAIVEGKELFLMAPTGVGKTMSCLYPAVRSMGMDLSDRIFYVSAKNETLSAGANAIRILMEKGLCFKSIRIHAKEKICPKSEPDCSPEACPMAKGHFDRINDALYALLRNPEDSQFYDAGLIAAQAEKWQVCPYQLQIEAASFCDAILGDYNYVFHPKARLARFFGEGAKGNYVILVDEAHNLVERGRNMYSASITKEHVLTAKKKIKDKKSRLAKRLEKVNQILLELRHLNESEGQGTYRILSSSDPDLQKLEFAVLSASEALQKLFQEPGNAALKKDLLDLYFEFGSFLSTFEQIDDHFVIYTENRTVSSGREKTRKEFVLKLFCVTPNALLTECIDKGRAAVLFSATLLPVNYYRHLLSSREDPPAIYAPSPFDPDHARILISKDVTTRYTARGPEMYRRIADYLFLTASAKKGNYLAFFPSYRMLRDVFGVYVRHYGTRNVDYVAQSAYMSEMDREIFMENFYGSPRRSLLAFAVMGGMFSEGIDLVHDKLIGVIVVGAGLPQISNEQTILKNYYDETENGQGFAYAYVYPGMNKVLQAAGRVIRTDTDRGVILLLDSRLNERQYRRLFPREWKKTTAVTLENVSDELARFWGNADSGK